jgi:hypothetical protein
MEHEVTILPVCTRNLNCGSSAHPRQNGPIVWIQRLARLADGNAAADLPAQPFHVLRIDVANSFERHLCEQRSLAVHPPPGDIFQVVARLADEDGRCVRLTTYLHHAGHDPSRIDFPAKDPGGIVKPSSKFFTPRQSRRHAGRVRLSQELGYLLHFVRILAVADAVLASGGDGLGDAPCR